MNWLAEGEGFEPPVRFPAQWFSRPPPSTTRPSLRIEKLARVRAIWALAISHQNAGRGALIFGRIARSPFGPVVSLHVSLASTRGSGLLVVIVSLGVTGTETRAFSNERWCSLI